MLWSCQNEVTPLTYADDNEAQYFSDYESPRYKWGLLDINGSTVLPPLYDALKDPIDLDHIPASLAGKWSYISIQGKPIVPFQFKSVLQWSDNAGWAQNWSNTYHIITADGISDTIKANSVKPFSYDLAPIKQGATWSYVDKSGQRVLNGKYLSASPFNEHKQAIIKTQSGYGVINLAGDQVIAPIYLSLKAEKLGYIAKSHDGYLYLDTRGNKRIDTVYAMGTPYSNDAALVKIDQTYHLIDLAGRITNTLPYPTVTEGGEGYWKYQENDLWGILDSQGNVLCPPKYTETYRYQEGYLTAAIDDKWGIIDQDCTPILPFSYPILWSFREGYTRIIADGFIQVIDTTGRVLPHINQIELKEFVNGVARYQHYPIYDTK